MLGHQKDRISTASLCRPLRSALPINALLLRAIESVVECGHGEQRSFIASGGASSQSLCFHRHCGAYAVLSCVVARSSALENLRKRD